MTETYWNETQVIGGMLIKPEKIPRLYEILSADDFLHDGYRRIYETVIGIYAEKGGFSLSDLPERELTADFKEKTLNAANNVLTTGNLEEYAKIVREYSIGRKAVEIINPYAGGISVNIPETIRGIADGLSELVGADVHQKIKLEHIKDGMLASVVEKIGRKTDPDSKILFGYSGLDAITGGIWKSDLCIIAARPGVGKSAFALNIIINLLAGRKKVGLYSFEMSREQVLQRMIAHIGRIKLQAVRDSDIPAFSMDGFVESVTRLSETQLYICDSLDVKIPEMAAECRIRGIDVLFVDYLTLTASAARHTNTYERVTELARGYKQLAQKLNIPVIVLAQLNRESEKRQDKRAQLSDLRDSGEIEQAANQIILMSPHEGNVLIDVAKNRQGGTGKVVMHFHKPFMRFAETEKRYAEPKKRRLYEID